MESVTAPEDVRTFGDQLAVVLRSVLGDDFIGACFVGSIALGGYVHGESDLDIVAVCRSALDDETRPAVVEHILATTVQCPARGLEFTLYRADVAASPPVNADFEVNVNGGPRMPRSVHLIAREEPPFWYVLDRAIAHRHGVRIEGPPPATLFADVRHDALLEAMLQSMRWHREHEKATLYSVLNACRAWRFAVQGVLGSKLDGAGWARERWREPELIDAAVDLRHGRQADLDPADVDALLQHVEGILAASA